MKRYSFILFTFFAFASSAQDLPPDTQQQLENVSEMNELEMQEDDNLLLQLDFFRKHPLNLNTATADDLRSLRFLTDLQIDHFIRYRNVLGNLLSIYELQAVPSWDLYTIQKILPYIDVANAIALKDNFLSRFNGGDQNLLFRMSRVLEQSKGYDTSLSSYYLGDRNHLMFRYRYQYKTLLYYGLTADKDAGEEFFKGAQSKGFDFYSFHFFVRNLSGIKALAVGDYTVNLGQGLIQWQSLGFGKSSDVASIKRQSPVLVPYRSAGEFSFNRGVGITLKKGKWETTVFASYKKISGNLVNDPILHFSSLLTSGYYRTASETEDRNKIALTSAGGNISLLSSDLKIGLNAVAHQFSIPFQKRDEPYNYYAINGRSLFNGSLDYSYTYRNVHLFGETAIDKNLNRAFVAGTLVSADPKIDLSFLYRNIQKDYQALFGNAFTENTAPVNETGLYAGIAIRPISKWLLHAYADLFQFPWLKFRVNAPSYGYDYLVQMNYQPSKQFELYARYRSKNKPMDGSGDFVINFPEDQLRRNFRLHLSNQLASDFFIRSRIELLWFSHGGISEEGFLGYIEAGHTTQKIAVSGRLQLFQTNSYNSRIYAYESDVLYSFSVPAFYDKGLRYYVNFNFQPTKNLEVRVRWASTVYEGKNKIGSGLDEINGNKKTDIKCQFRYLFSLSKK